MKKIIFLLPLLLLTACASNFLETTLESVKGSTESDPALVGSWSGSTGENSITLVLNGDQSYFEESSDKGQEEGNYYVKDKKIVLLPTRVTDENGTVSGQVLEDEEKRYASAYTYSVDRNTLTLEVPDGEKIVLEKS